MVKNIEKSGGANIMSVSALGGAAGMVASALLLAISAALTVTGRIPDNYMREVTVLCVGLGALTGSYFAGKKMGSKTIPVGGIAAVIMIFIILVLSAFTDAGMFSGELTLPVLISTLAGGLFGGVLCAAPKKRKR